MTEFWERAFNERRVMWGHAPTVSASAACETFTRAGARSVLIPGIGYGRNARPFLERGMSVAGIEISATAIELARSQLGLDLSIAHGSVADMPFDHRRYDGIFCYGLAHLLDAPGRQKLIRDCYRQLEPGGHMIFTVISKKAPMYGQGPRLGDDWYERLPGLPMYFYDTESANREFGPYGLIELSEVDEPASEGATLPFINAVCRRDVVTVTAAEAVARLRAGQVEVTVRGALQPDEVVAIAEALETSRTTLLTMGGCRIDDAGGVAIANALRGNTALRELWLFGNEIADAGGEALGAALSSNVTLTTLCLNDNRLGDAGALAIGDALRSSPSLAELGLGRNQIGAVGGAAIGAALASNRSLIALSLDHNRLGDVGASRIGAALRHNTTLKTLRLSHNEIGSAAAEALRAAVRDSPTLRALSIDEAPPSPALRDGP